MENAIQDEMPQFRSVLRENRAQDASQTLQDVPRHAPRRPRTPQDAPKRPPRGPKLGARTRYGASRDAPKTLPRPKMLPRRLKRPPDLDVEASRA